MTRCGGEPEREYQYAACDLLITFVKRLTSDDLAAIESLVVTKSWWDTVDALAISSRGSDRPDATVNPATPPSMPGSTQTICGWRAPPSSIRTRGRRAPTKPGCLRFCQQRAEDTDFFMRKAIGWALREYSKTAPDAVRAFVAGATTNAVGPVEA